MTVAMQVPRPRKGDRLIDRLADADPRRQRLAVGVATALWFGGLGIVRLPLMGALVAGSVLGLICSLGLMATQRRLAGERPLALRGLSWSQRAALDRAVSDPGVDPMWALAHIEWLRRDVLLRNSSGAMMLSWAAFAWSLPIVDLLPFSKQVPALFLWVAVMLSSIMLWGWRRRRQLGLLQTKIENARHL